MKHQGTVTLETEHLILRRFTKNDLEQIYYNCWSEYDVWKWTNYAPMTCIAEVLTNAGMFTDNWINEPFPIIQDKIYYLLHYTASYSLTTPAHSCFSFYSKTHKY